MKPGFWNRLALVVSLLAMLVAPTIYVLRTNSEIQKARAVNYEICMDIAEDLKSERSLEDYQKFADNCRETRYPKVDYVTPGWDEWLSSMGLTALICSFIYSFILGVLAVSRWVWRGRWA